MIEKYGVSDVAEQQKAELATVKKRIAELRAYSPLTDNKASLEKQAEAQADIEELERRETELEAALANQ